MIDDILSMVAATDSAPQLPPAGPRQWKSRCDDIISSLLKIIYDDNAFKTCKAAWRGVEFLLRRGTIKDGSGLMLQVLPVSSEGLKVALERLTRTGSADPPNLILIDWPFDNTPRSTALMETIISTAHTLMAPTAYWIIPASSMSTHGRSCTGSHTSATISMTRRTRNGGSWPTCRGPDGSPLSATAFSRGPYRKETIHRRDGPSGKTNHYG